MALEVGVWPAAEIMKVEASMKVPEIIKILRNPSKQQHFDQEFHFLGTNLATMKVPNGNWGRGGEGSSLQPKL